MTFHVELNFRKLFIVAIGLTCTAALAIGLTIWWLRSEAIADASKDTANLATVLAEQTSRSVQSIDLVLNEIRNQLESFDATTPNDFDPLLRMTGLH